MRFECKHCAGALSFTLSVDMQHVPRVCPACNAEWVDMYSNRKPIEVLKSFFDPYARITRMLSEENAPSPVGFALRLELKSYFFFGPRFFQTSMFFRFGTTMVRTSPPRSGIPCSFRDYFIVDFEKIFVVTLPFRGLGTFCPAL